MAAFKVSSATASEEWDALPAKKSAMPRAIEQEGSVWTAPETWLATAVKQAEAEKAAAAAAAAEAAAAAASGEEEGDEAAGGQGGGGEAAERAGEGEASASAAEVATVAEALENKKQAAFAADAYAFGMVSWEVRAACVGSWGKACSLLLVLLATA